MSHDCVFFSVSSQPAITDMSPRSQLFHFPTTTGITVSSVRHTSSPVSGGGPSPPCVVEHTPPGMNHMAQSLAEEVLASPHPVRSTREPFVPQSAPTHNLLRVPPLVDDSPHRHHIADLYSNCAQTPPLLRPSLPEHGHGTPSPYMRETAWSVGNTRLFHIAQKLPGEMDAHARSLMNTQDPDPEADDPDVLISAREGLRRTAQLGFPGPQPNLQRGPRAIGHEREQKRNGPDYPGDNALLKEVYSSAILNHISCEPLLQEKANGPGCSTNNVPLSVGSKSRRIALVRGPLGAFKRPREPQLPHFDLTNIQSPTPRTSAPATLQKPPDLVASPTQGRAPVPLAPCGNDTKSGPMMTFKCVFCLTNVVLRFVY